jgi:hypothetical protein
MIRTTSIAAAQFAESQVAAVRENPAARLKLAMAMYRGPAGLAPHHVRFRRAALSFMRWEVDRGVLNPAHGRPPGSAWWRAMNERLLRVLYAHALVAAPRLALGPLAALGPALGDPRLGMASMFLSLGRVLPHRYPLSADLDLYLRDERGIGRTLDYALIGPRLQRLYEWSADELEHPQLRGLIRDGAPVYAWPANERDAWDRPAIPVAAAILRLAAAPGRRLQ